MWSVLIFDSSCSLALIIILVLKQSTSKNENLINLTLPFKYKCFLFFWFDANIITRKKDRRSLIREVKAASMQPGNS